jgi:hypothetical protein
MIDLNETIATIKKEVESFEQKAQAGRQAIELLRKLNGESEINVPQIQPPQNPPNKGLKTKRAKKSENIPKKKSKYKGVSMTSRGDKWRAQFYIKGKGVIQLKDKNGKGVFNTEDEAHRIYEDFKEQLENNPDRPDEMKKRQKMVKVYECSYCHVSYKSKPQVCPGCNRTVFKEKYEEE